MLNPAKPCCHTHVLKLDLAVSNVAPPPPQALVRNTRLTRMDLSDNQLGHIGAGKLVEALTRRAEAAGVGVRPLLLITAGNAEIPPVVNEVLSRHYSVAQVRGEN